MRPDLLHLQPEWLDAQQPREGRFVLGPLLGQGGMGEVREAWDLILCRTVALKTLRKMDPVSLIRFMHEARIQSRMAHPNICQIYDVDSSEGAPRISMQLVRGPTLADAAGDLTVAGIVQILAQVAEAIEAAHRLNLIHRDLKPSNILLEATAEGGWTPYVCDFGLAMGLGDPTLTAPQAVHGTPAYMAPEQAQGDRAHIGPATDVFALGGTLHYALHGSLPQAATTRSGPRLAWRARDSRQAVPGATRPVPRDLDLIVAKCMEPDPQARYPSAAALAEDLRAFLRGQRIHPYPGGPRTWLVQPRTLALAGTLAACALLAAWGLAQRHAAAEDRERAAWAEAYAQESEAMDKQLSLEKMLPVHDLRPAYARLRAQVQAIQARMPGQGAAAQGPAHFALGRGWLLLGDPSMARRELEQAQAEGLRTPELACLLARAVAGSQFRIGQGVLFASGAAAATGHAAARVEALAGAGTAGADDYVLALGAYLRMDFGRAADLARKGILQHPWAATTLESLALATLGRQALEAGDDLLAEARLEEAMAVARNALEADPSDDRLHHAYLQAGRGLATLQLMRGDLTPAALADLQQAAETALELNPEDPDLQDDWLGSSLLKAMRLAALDADPEPELKAALQFLDNRCREPLRVELRADRMLLHWQLAQWAFRLGRDPGPELARALEDPGHTPFLGRDYLGEVLNFKAQVEAAQGRDPRPAVAEALARLEPLLGPGAPRSLWAAAAQSWLIQGRWEAAHGLDAGPSLQRSRILSERAQARHAL
jgi:serine/threonine-protein kinase